MSIRLLLCGALALVATLLLGMLYLGIVSLEAMQELSSLIPH